jgi:leucine dehydrogenase
MVLSTHVTEWPPERVDYIEDAASGLHGVVVLHSTTLGPAAGGCRLWHYDDDGAMAADAMRLAEGMSYKNALAGLPLGGGKAVLRRPAGEYDRTRLFEAFGRAVAAMDGAYVTAEDVGTSVGDMTAVRRNTWHVAGLTAQPDQPGGDPSPWTARGVFLSMQVAAERRLGRTLDGVTVAVQGLGHVGAALCDMLHGAGARLIVADLHDAAVAAMVRRHDAVAMDKDDILAAEADIFAPCALGAVLNGNSIAALRATVVCGAANNVLGTPEDGARLADKGVLYAPDYVVNAGGIINVAAEYLRWTSAEAAERVDAIGDRLREIFDLAERSGDTTSRTADRLARSVIAAGAVPKLALAG